MNGLVKMKIKMGYSILLALTLTVQSSTHVSAESDPIFATQIEHFIDSHDIEKQIPGFSIGVVQNGEIIYKKGYGYADVGKQIAATAETPFKIGAIRESFTGLAIQQLVQTGQLHLKDPVSQYLPWFSIPYKGKAANVTLEQVLYQKSGIPKGLELGAKTIDQDATVREALHGKSLRFRPGSQFEYSSANEIILNLVIAKATGQSSSVYINENILQPFDLERTYPLKSDSEPQSIAKGYKRSFLQLQENNSSESSSFTSNAEDMANWLAAHMTLDRLSVSDQLTVRSTLEVDRSVNPDPAGISYASGWNSRSIEGLELSQGEQGNDFSSYLAFRPAERLGVVVLANMNSAIVPYLGQSVLDLLMDKPAPDPPANVNNQVDLIATLLTGIFSLLGLLLLWQILVLANNVWKQKYKRNRLGAKGIALGGILTTILFYFGYCLYVLPAIVSNTSWTAFLDSRPDSILAAVITVFTTVFLYFLYSALSRFYHDQKPWLYLIVLSISSGFGNTMIIFIVNVAISGVMPDPSKLMLYFALGMLLYLFCQKLLMNKLILLANEQVYKLRSEIIERLLRTPYSRFEQIKDGRIYTSLENDTEIISRFANTVIPLLVSAITLLCCFVYLAILNKFAFLLTAGGIFLAAGSYAYISHKAEVLWETNRDIRNVFFKNIQDLLGGFKELSLDPKRRGQFKQDILANLGANKASKEQGEMKFANVFVIGESLLTFTIGLVAFVFPLIFQDIANNVLQSYVLVLLYMIGPVLAILGAFPQVLQMKISWNRIKQLLGELSTMEDRAKRINDADIKKIKSIELLDVEYHYYGENGETFSIGPLNDSFHAGELIFITGGNGSGKSTLAKLITGLYAPSNGSILVNGAIVDSDMLGAHFSTIFADYYLFDKLYGVDYDRLSEDKIKYYLEKLGMDKKVSITSGAISTLKLSTGQRKRLALLISYLEDKSVCLFDEVAADQDPEFRKYFYEILLPELKSQGKCVIAITHDDEYFQRADKVITMKSGKMLSLMLAK